jgi:hypothetical protein
MKKPRKPKCCQWMMGVCSPQTSTWQQCKNPPTHEVWCVNPDACVGWVCAEHSVAVIRHRLGQLR